MKKKIFFLVLIICGNIFSQNEEIPEGWDKIILEGEVAYMNLITGDVSNKLPKGAAKKPQKVKEYEPTKIHYVKSGDTFSKIARQHNISLAELYKLNSVDNFDEITVGQEVVVGYKDDASSSINNTGNEDFHIVKSGETLYRVSQIHGISVNKLKDLNSLNSNIIRVGQRLIIRYD